MAKPPLRAWIGSIGAALGFMAVMYTMSPWYDNRVREQIKEYRSRANPVISRVFSEYDTNGNNAFDFEEGLESLDALGVVAGHESADDGD